MLHKTAMLKVSLSLFSFALFLGAARAQHPDFFYAPYSKDYENTMAEKIYAGINEFLDIHAGTVISNRGKFWDRNFDSPEAYEASVSSNRQRLREIIGAVDWRKPPRLYSMGHPGQGEIIAENSKCAVYQITWEVMGGLQAEGLMLLPKGTVKASVVMVPDADEIPESYAGLAKGSGLALQLAESGVRVILPVLVNRDSRYSGGKALMPYNPWRNSADSASVWTNQPHREWIHRQGYIMGRHIIGLEVQKILAAVDWLVEKKPAGASEKIGVMGYGEGGLLALYSAALDTRIDATWVSGYFGPREELWKEPVYRNIWGLLTEFGDAEIASLIAPRPLIIEASPVPAVEGPPAAKEGQLDYAVPGKLETPSASEVEKEFKRLLALFPTSGALHPDATLLQPVAHYGTEAAQLLFAEKLDITLSQTKPPVVTKLLENTGPEERQRRVFDNMVEFIQDMIPKDDHTRYAFFKGDFSSTESWERDMKPYREKFYEEMVGNLKQPLLPLSPKIRQIYDEPAWKGFEVALEAIPGVYAWGILAVPKDIKPGERRPAVVMQHGIGGLPSTSMFVESYHGVLQALVNRGFVVFSPFNPYQFNIRKANPLKASAFSIIIPQHQQILNFLSSLDYVDYKRVALYGKSWGGRTAQRVPVVLDGYSVAISSAYFNDWVPKTVSTHYRNSYFFTKSIGIYEWNMGNTFTHAEMALMIAPRPFMVESGYLDGVAAHEMVAYEFAKVKRIYDCMGISDRVDLELFMGGHDINGQGTFRFLHKHLDWPEPPFPTEAQEISK